MPNYVEPFFGSGAVLLGRPHTPGSETVNDRDCFVSNFWRALKADPSGVAEACDWPVNEADLHSRHMWLSQETSEFRERMLLDPDYYDVKIAGWWVWGQSQWLGTGWCAKDRTAKQHRGHLKRQRPIVGSRAGVLRYHGSDLYDYLDGLSARLRSVRVVCGDWSRVCGLAPTINVGTTGVFLDPPYAADDRYTRLYSVDSKTVAADVQTWALERGDDPQMRIALCGYEGDYEMPDAWECMPWVSSGGYGARGLGNGRANRHLERIWFSPHCLRRRSLFDGLEDECE